jgi:hypothetical protein
MATVSFLQPHPVSDGNSGSPCSLPFPIPLRLVRATTTVLPVAAMTTDPHRPNKQPGFFRKLFHKQPARLSAAASDTPQLVASRSLPRALADLSFTEKLQQIWDQVATEEAAEALHHECITQLKRVRDLRVPTVVSAGPVSGAIVSVELTLSGFESRGAYIAPGVARIVTHTFGECRQLLKLLASCVKDDDCCDCRVSSAKKNRGCEYRDKMRAFLDTCWVHPPVVHGTTMEWGGGDGGVTAGIRKSVLTASLRVILAFARGEYDGVETNDDAKPLEMAAGGAVSTLPPLSALGQQYTEAKCRAKFEVTLVVRDFLQLDQDP